jgi:hypothetical protein
MPSSTKDFHVAALLRRKTGNNGGQGDISSNSEHSELSRDRMYLSTSSQEGLQKRHKQWTSRWIRLPYKVLSNLRNIGTF